jgi:hypothetical protein
VVWRIAPAQADKNRAYGVGSLSVISSDERSEKCLRPTFVNHLWRDFSSFLLEMT